MTFKKTNYAKRYFMRKVISFAIRLAIKVALLGGGYSVVTSYML